MATGYYVEVTRKGKLYRVETHGLMEDDWHMTTNSYAHAIEEAKKWASELGLHLHDYTGPRQRS